MLLFYVFVGIVAKCNIKVHQQNCISFDSAFFFLHQVKWTKINVTIDFKSIA